MKNFCVGVIMVGVATAVGAQTRNAPSPAAPTAESAPTAIERMQLGHGRMIVKGYSTIAQVSGLGGEATIKVVELREGSTRNLGITIEVKERGRLERSDTAYVDRDEVDALLNAATALMNTNKDVTKLEGFEAVYRTRGNLEVAQLGRPGGSVSFAVGSGRVVKTYVFYESRDQVERFVAALKEAKAALDAMK